MLPILTAVIPVAKSTKDLSNLRKTLLLASASDINVVLIVDINTPSPNHELQTLCDQAKTLFPTTTLIQGVFGAPGLARNQAMPYIKTEYVTYWDADDLPEIAEIVKTLENIGDRVDYVLGSYKLVTSEDSRIIGIPEFFLTRKIHLVLNPGLWRIVFRTNRIHEAKFGSSRMGEDQVFLLNSGFFESSNCVFSETVFYNYYKNVEGQLTSSKVIIPEIIESIKEVFLDVNYAKFSSIVFRFAVILKLTLSVVFRKAKGMR